MKEERISPKDYENLLKIAKQTLPAIRERGDLETRDHDAEDFIETSVWSLKEALIQAFESGRKQK